MIKILRLCLIGLSLGLVACSTTYKYNYITSPEATELDRGSVVYVSKAYDGSYGNKVFSGSGNKASGALANALMVYSRKVYIGNVEGSLSQILLEAEDYKAKYAFVPKIINWEPHAAAWNFRPTRLNIEISVYDVATKKLLFKKDLAVRGRIITLTSQQVESILDDAMLGFVKTIY